MLNNAEQKPFTPKYKAPVYSIDTHRPISEIESNLEPLMQETSSISEQIKESSLSQLINFLDKNNNQINITSLQMLLIQISQFNAKIPVPEFSIEPDGTMSMLWYGSNGSFILAFNGETGKKEYSLVCKDGDLSYGTLSCITDILYYINKLK